MESKFAAYDHTVIAMQLQRRTPENGIFAWEGCKGLKGDR
jgi:hypothetical protein